MSRPVRIRDGVVDIAAISRYLTAGSPAEHISHPHELSNSGDG